MGEIRNLSEYEKQQRDAYNDALRLLNEQREIIAERDAEIEAHEKREAALQMQVTRLEQSVSAMSSDYHRAFNENMAYLAFVEAFDEWIERDAYSLDYVDDRLDEAREKLRSVIDGMD